MGQVKKIPTRTCTGCRQVKNKKDLIRVVRDKEGNVFVDVTGRQNGRGAYICPNEECLEKAVKISQISEEVYQQLKKELGDVNE